MRFRGIMVVVLVVFGFIFSVDKVFSSEYKVGEVSGLTYNEVWRQWFDQDFSVWVHVSGGVETIVFTAETGVGEAVVVLGNTRENISRLRSLVLKSIEWSAIAVSNKADINRELGCFGNCKKDSLGFKKGQVTLTFFATNGGTQTSLILRIIHYDNMFIKTAIYMDLEGMKKFQAIVDKIGQSFVKVREKAEKEKLFK